MRLQSNGWRAKDNADQARKAHQALITKLKRERVAGDEHTPAELVEIQRDLRAGFYARQNKEQPA